MPPTGRDEIQQGLDSKDAEWSQMSNSISLGQNVKSSAAYEFTVHMQSCRENVSVPEGFFFFFMRTSKLVQDKLKENRGNYDTPISFL